MRNLSKNIFVNTLACRTLGWRLRNEDASNRTSRPEPTLGEKFRIEQGIEIGNRAKSLYPGGVLIDETTTASACARTRSAIDDPSISIIFEGAFLTGGVAARADILKRKDNQWHLVEVKSSVNDKEKFIDDMAYTAMVLARCGLDISDVSLLLISRDFRLGMDNQQLFVEIDHTDEVLPRARQFEQQWQLVEETTSASQMPEPQLKFICRKCPLFGECLGKDIDNHIFDIPRLSESKFDKLAQLGIVSIEDIPTSFPLTANQTIVWESVREKRPFVGDTLAVDLSKILWPAHYLDFESLMTGIPLYPDVAPYTQIPTQYSVHRCSGIGDVTDHFEYMADPTTDCRLELAQNLIGHLQGEGNIIVYS
ncbi:DUF2779 domain-containing protein, partial [Acidobacteria bacterium AH-259-A15]|nr:DUF2779 domain-containing protein [Acidobacteria bacterium AH-259-A15]